MQSTLTRAKCTPVGAKGHPGRLCESLYPAKGKLAVLHTPQIVGCVPSGPAFVNSGPSTGREIALTFDDGPWYDTPQFLDILERYHVPATFFEIGEQISTYGEGGAIERRMLADGDMIGDHTWSHPNVSGRRRVRPRPDPAHGVRDPDRHPWLQALPVPGARAAPSAAR